MRLIAILVKLLSYTSSPLPVWSMARDDRNFDLQRVKVTKVKYILLDTGKSGNKSFVGVINTALI